MTIEVEPGRERLGPRIIETEETGRLDLSVPLKVDLAAGPNWLDVSEEKL